MSELRRARPHGAVLAWIADVPSERLRLSTVTVGEIQAGIEITREQDAPGAAALEAWLDQIIATFAVLPMDAAAFRAWAQLKHRKSDTLFEDAVIAATAGVHGLIVATRNTRDFAALGVETINPFGP